MTTTRFQTGIEAALGRAIAAIPRKAARLAVRVCECGHTGDGEAGQHAGMSSDGECLYRDCTCKAFKAKRGA